MPKVTTGISIDDILVRKAKKHAAKERRTFSNYVEGLIQKDLEPVIITSEPQHSKAKRIVRRKRT